MTAFPIDPISAASPDMSDADMQALKDSIAAIGQQVPILVWRGSVIDGRKRMAACEDLGREPIVTTLADDAAPQDYATAMNILRTHYTASQRAMFAERIASAKRGFNRFSDESSNSTIVTRPQAARVFGVEQNLVGTARRVRKQGVPEVAAAVERGLLSLHAAEQIATKVPHENQARVVEEVVRETKGKRNTPSKIINAAAPGTRLPPRRDITQVRERSLRTIHACCTAIEQFMDAPIANDADVAGWREWIRDSVRTLNHFNRRLEKARDRSA